MDTVTIISSLISGLVALVSFRVGWRMGWTRAHRRYTATCSCGHGRGFHEDGKGRCMADRFMRDYKDGCQVYDGPEPLPSIGDILKDGG